MALLLSIWVLLAGAVLPPQPEPVQNNAECPWDENDPRCLCFYENPNNYFCV
jgi:hypothetical protein